MNRTIPNLSAMILFSGILLIGCSLAGDVRTPSGPGEHHEEEVDVETPSGFIGGACQEDEDCEYEGGVCLTEGFPGGMCSLPCDTTCPDRDGEPTTFCADTTLLPFSAETLGIGACVSRCDLGKFAGAGCRDEYGCATTHRPSDPDASTLACLPNSASELSACVLDLSDRGVEFETTFVAPTHPEGRPDLTCEVEDAVRLLSPVNGVYLDYYDGTPTNVLASCEMAHALADTIEDVKPYGVNTLLHIGTYNCRAISGSDTLSQHSYANAIDIYGFEFDDGSIYTLIDDWEHDTDAPQTAAGEFLYSASYRWYENWIWNIILTPNYNAGHDNHFHVDLTDSSHYIGFTDGRYWGPALYAD